MNDNELINTGISGFEPYQFDPAALQLMPTAYDRVANRAQRRITDTQKRVQDLVKLDPTNPISLLITMLGANQTAGIRDDLRSLRKDSISKQKKKLAKETAEDLRKTQLADLKIRGLEDAFGTFINREHHGDVNAGLNDPNMQDKVLAISKEYQPMSTKELAKLMQTYSEENTAYKVMKTTGGDQVLPQEEKAQYLLVKSIFATIKEHFEHQGVVFKPGEWALEPPDENPTDDTSTSGKVDPAGSNKVEPAGSKKELASVKEALKPKKINVEVRKPTGVDAWYEEMQRGLDELKKSSKKGELKKDVTGFIKSFFGDDDDRVKVNVPPIVERQPDDTAPPTKQTIKQVSPKIDMTGTDSAGSFDSITNRISKAPIVDSKKERRQVPEVSPRSIPLFPADQGVKPSPVFERKSFIDTLIDDVRSLLPENADASQVNPRDSIRESRETADRLQAIRRGEINEQGYTPEEQSNIDRTQLQSDISSGTSGLNTGSVPVPAPKAVVPVPKVDPSMIPKADRDLGEERKRAEEMQKKARMKRLRSDPFINKLIQIESSGRANAIGYKMHRDPRSGKFVYDTVTVTDQWGRKVNRKIPVSYGLMQITIPTAKASKLPAAQKAFKGKSDKVIRRILLEDPELNVRIGKEFADKIRGQLKANKYLKHFKKQEIDILVGAAYNWKGEGFNKLINEAQPENLDQVLARVKFPAETRRQIKELRKAFK